MHTHCGREMALRREFPEMYISGRLTTLIEELKITNVFVYIYEQAAKIIECDFQNEETEPWTESGQPLSPWSNKRKVPRPRNQSRSVLNHCKSLALSFQLLNSVFRDRRSPSWDRSRPCFSHSCRILHLVVQHSFAPFQRWEFRIAPVRKCQAFPRILQAISWMSYLSVICSYLFGPRDSFLTSRPWS